MKLFLFLWLLVSAGALQAQEKVVVNARDYSGKDLPVYIKLPGRHSMDMSWELQDPGTGKRFPAQLFDSTTLVFIPSEQIASTETFILKPSTRMVKPAVTVQNKTGGLLVTVKDKPVFFYHTKEAMPPAGSPDYYRRSGFIHPLYSPDGAILTDDFPAGHMHQHGIFMTWVNTTFRNQKVDFWNQHSQTGTVQHVVVTDIKQGPVFSRIRMHLRHISLAHGAVLEEAWEITIYPFSEHFLFDLESAQTNTTHDTLYLNKYHYGGLAVRGSKEWNRHDSLHFRNNWKILTSEGKQDSSANHTPARWTDASGKVSGKTGGVTVFGHPENFRYPQAIRVHPDMPYWCFAPVVDGEFTINPGATYRSAFRFYVHNGTADTATIERVGENYKNVPLKRNFK